MSPMSADLSYRPEDDGFLEGKMLIAMPSIGDDRFDRTVIYMCVHNPDGAMGIVVNKPADNITFPDLLDRLSIRVPGTRLPKEISCPVLAGGPVEMGRGFVLHTQDYFSEESTLPVDENVGLTASVDILRAMATGCGLGARPARRRNPGKWLAPLRPRSRASVRAQSRCEISFRARQARHQSLAAVGRGGPRLTPTLGQAHSCPVKRRRCKNGELPQPKPSWPASCGPCLSSLTPTSPSVRENRRGRVPRRCRPARA